MTTVRKSNGYTPDVVDAVAEMLWQAEKGKRCEEEIKSHAPEGRNYTNQQYVDLLLENEKLKEAMESVKSEIGCALYSNKSKDAKEHYLKNAERYIEEALNITE